ncbi:glycosyltransferase [Anabaena sphaerica FACHB-251]|uniref:Glycosyltransferase n=1 Tax=Anabaena sphaerica FACHB-251 TaxID=2692883 RepID=A0A926WCA6_9NOST|nr:glycosyltransferase [Anabaena sphaerica]MBD2291991.1 glycosyltransferase [Anabaena sphaerica FACHB-251]
MISVVIPVYNGEKTIEETIISVINQTFTDFEILVINDGSNDATLDVVKQIKDSRVKLFSYPNAGQIVSRNRGLELATGKYISFIDADDIWTYDKLEAQFKALQNKPEAAVAYSWTNYIDESSQFLRSGLHITVNGDALAKLLLTNFLENGSNGLFLTPALRDLGGFDFDKDIEGSEDWDLYLRLAAKYPFVCVSAPQILYRVSTNSFSTNINKMEKSGLKVIKKAFEKAPKDLQHLKNQSLANLYMYLTLKSLEGYPKPQQSLLALKLLGQTLKYQPSIAWNRRRLTSIAILKSLVGIFLPGQKAQEFWNYIKKFQQKKVISY